MNLRKIQLLQEAYLSVYEETDAERDKRLADRRARVAELQVSGRVMTPARRAREKAQQRKSEQEQEKLDKILGSIRGGSSRRSEKPMGSTPPAEKEAAPEANRRLKSKTKSDTLASRADEILRGMRNEAERSLNREDVNVFDILISHLLDEGYAEDVKNAYCILENMSEDWVLEILDEASLGSLALKGAKSAVKAVRDYGADYPMGSKRRAVSDTIDKLHWASLSYAEKKKRTNAKHRARNTKKGHEEIMARNRRAQEISDRRNRQR